ncbi:hypothetical protein J6590_076280 [Homalodisca vitripennis]|nr:hypothetical protein J6590_076280 [Homalodisca vitripennis]
MGSLEVEDSQTRNSAAWHRESPAEDLQNLFSILCTSALTWFTAASRISSVVNRHLLL